MIRLTFVFLTISLCSCIAQQPIDMKTPFESNNNSSATYHEAVAYYQKLADSPYLQCSPIGSTDSGHPLHEVVVTNDGIFDPATIRKSGKVILFVNNGIHPGEPCGIDASMLLARDLLQDKQELLEHTVVVIIPVYNIGGALNRSSHSRANQNGPAAYGFRGNAKNLDLNRDFVKSDSKNARAFATIYNKWQPQIFIDNHTSNGADYQYIMTLIATQKDKLHPVLADHMTSAMLPALYDKMNRKDFEMTPYVYSIHETPDEGIKGFLDLGRYSSGYAAMHHAISFMPETHMLKEYADRVRSTYAFMESMLEYINMKHEEVLSNYDLARKLSQSQKEWTLQFELDTNTVEEISFRGFEAKYKPSQVTGQDRLYYDRSANYEKSIPFYNSYKSTLQVSKPKAYVLPQAYDEVANLLKRNGVEMSVLERDTVMEVDMYYIDDYSSVPRPYEGHFLHHSVELRTELQTVQFHKGDYLIFTDQSTNRYLIETLEPQGPDSYFAWNFFDGILMQKEHFSPYVWEDLAADLLAADETLKAKFENKKKEDSTFASDAKAQLAYIYQHSKYMELTYMRYPVGRLMP